MEEMKLEKFAHACFTVTINSQTLVIDPGNLTDDFVMPASVVGVVITHQHPDHHDKILLGEILRQFPVDVLTTDDTTVGLEPDNSDSTVRAVAPGDTVEIGPFSLEFFGGEHARIDESIAPLHNVGMMINGLVYYPGDSFADPLRPVKVLALPVSAPWLKIVESLTFLRTVKPERAFPTHDAILSDAGKAIVDRLAGNTARECGTVYERLVDTLDIPS